MKRSWVMVLYKHHDPRTYILSPSIYLNHLSKKIFFNYLHHLEVTSCNYSYILHAR